MFEWCNEKKFLPNLEVSGEDKHIVYRYKNEKVTEEAYVIFDVLRYAKPVIKSVEYTIIIDDPYLTNSIVVKKPLNVIVRGDRNKRRRVTHYLTKENAMTMRLGLTYHSQPGSWSSTPHEFERGLPQENFEEVFFYLLGHEENKAIQVGKGIFAHGQNVDSVWPITNMSFSVIPFGYHPVVGEPDVRVGYIWCYICKKPEWEKV